MTSPAEFPDRISSLRLLAAIRESGQLSHAAAALGLSPSAASHLLAGLRAHFGDPLFVRTGTGLAPTPRMTELEPRIRRILEAIDRLDEKTVFNPASASGVFRISAHDNAFTAFLVPVIPEIELRAPGLSLEVSVVASTARLLDALRDGRIDLAIKPVPPDRTDILVEPLPGLKYAILVRRDHPLSRIAKLRPVAAADLAQFVQIVPKILVSRTERRPWAELRARGVRTLVVPYFNASPFLLLETNHFQWIPKVTARRWTAFGAFEAIDPPEGLAVTLGPNLIWSARSDRDPLHQWVRGVILAGARRVPERTDAPNGQDGQPDDGMHPHL